MIVLDTHVWLWWSNESRRLSRAARGAIEQAEAIGIPVASCYEVATLAARGRITPSRPVREWIARALAEPRVSALPLTSEIASDAALLDRRRFVGDPLDRMIYATARSVDAALVTKDRRLLEFDPARTIW